MRKALAFLLFLALWAMIPIAAQGQAGNTTTLLFPGAPTGGCAFVMYAVRADTGAFYDCFGGGWNLISAGGGGGTVTHTAGALTAGQLVIGNAGADITVGNLTGDATTAGATATTVVALRGLALPTLAASTGYIYDSAGTLSLSTSASNLTTGTLPHAQLPALVSGDIPNNAANTTGNATTATNLATYPTLCTAGQFSTGFTTGTPPTNNCGTPAGGGNVSTSGTPTTGTPTEFASSTTIKNGVLADFETFGLLNNCMTTLGDVIYGGAAGICTRLPGPTAAGTYFLTETPASAAATAEVFKLAGVVLNPQTGTTYTYLSTDATQDRAGYTSFSNASAIAVTLPQAGSTGFGSNWVNVSCDIGAGTATITPTTSTISYSTGSAYTSAASTMTLTTGQCAWIYTDNTNYFAIKFSGGGGSGPTIQTNGTNNTSQTTLNFVNPATFNGLTVTFSNPTSGNETFTFGGTLGNAGLTNPSTTVNGQTCTLGSTCTVNPPLDKSTNGLANPTADATFTYPNTSTSGFTLTGTAPASSAGATGTAATTLFNLTGVTGGADSNATGTAGVGTAYTWTAGNGGAGTGTNTVGGGGGAWTLTAGNGGASLGTGANSNGGGFTFNLGAPGTGGSGTAGKSGVASFSDGTHAGFWGCSQGTAVTTSNVNIPANSFFYQCPTSVTAYNYTVPGAAATNNNSALLCPNATGACTYAKMSQTAITSGTAYTNATTTFSSVVGGSGQTLSFSVEANTNYLMSCQVLWSASAATAGPKFQITGPASPTAVQYSVMQAVTATTDGTAGATAFSTSLNASGATVVATTNEPAEISMGLVNGANAGTVTVQAASQGTGTLTIQPGSYCQLQ